MCRHILVVKLMDGGKHTAKECADKEELAAAIADAQSRPGTAGYEVFDLVSKVRKSIEWREDDVQQQEVSTATATEAEAAGGSDGDSDLTDDADTGKYPVAGPPSPSME